MRLAATIMAVALLAAAGCSESRPELHHEVIGGSANAIAREWDPARDWDPPRLGGKVLLLTSDQDELDSLWDAARWRGPREHVPVPPRIGDGHVAVVVIVDGNSILSPEVIGVTIGDEQVVITTEGWSVWKCDDVVITEDTKYGLFAILFGVDELAGDPEFVFDVRDTAPCPPLD